MAISREPGPRNRGGPEVQGEGGGGCYSVRLGFRPRGRMDGRGMASALSMALSVGAQGLARDGHLAGEVRALARFEGGFIQVDLLPFEQGVRVEDAVGGSEVGPGTLEIAAAVEGCSDQEVRRGVERMVSALARYLWVEEDRHQMCAGRVMASR